MHHPVDELNVAWMELIFYGKLYSQCGNYGA